MTAIQPITFIIPEAEEKNTKQANHPQNINCPIVQMILLSLTYFLNLFNSCSGVPRPSMVFKKL